MYMLSSTSAASVRVTYLSVCACKKDTFGIRRGKIFAQMIDVSGTHDRVDFVAIENFKPCLLSTSQKRRAVLHYDSDMKAYLPTSPSAILKGLCRKLASFNKQFEQHA